MNSHVYKINRNLVIGWMIIVSVLFVSYCGEVIKGERTITYLLAFMLATAVPAFICLFLYRRKPDRLELRYYIVVGYFIMYVFSMMTGSTSMVFSYILPMLSLLVLYHQPGLILATGGASFVVNIISIGKKVINRELTLANSKDAEIQMALLILCFGGSYMAAKLYNEITNQNMSYLKMLDEKNSQIQKMTLQTITTIANTIDAKDEYTKGHSKRVSEYAAAIAQEMGLPEKEVENIRSVALLHDIGKIGVPDAVLNKPGRLNQEEYHLMKQHTVIGAEILKDIGMIPGIDVGAKYHHERYDGKGYPDGLSGDEIPHIARIIAVADAYDAMSSNRVYRKHLSEEKVMQELESGSGKQFDPEATQTLIYLLKEKRLENIKPEAEQEQNYVIKILNRVMERQEEQIAEKMVLDDLTGVYNRSNGEKLIREALEEKGEGCLMIFDLDHFRKVNDMTGFVRGDILLKASADCIRNIEGNKIAARFGGDDFVVFFPDITTEKEAARAIEGFMEDIRRKIREQAEMEGLSVSAGIAIHTKEKDDFSSLLQKADKALYFAKQQGGGSYYIHQEEALPEERNLSKVDLSKLIELIHRKGSYEGSFKISYPEFAKIYEFIKKVADRNKQKIQILMFTVSYNEGVKISAEEQEKVLEYLEHAIVTSVRGVDITTKYSSTQRIVMLMNLEEEQIHVVTDRIMKEFYKMYDSKEISVYYDVADLN